MTPRRPLPADPQDRYEDLSRRYAQIAPLLGVGMSDAVCARVRDLVRDFSQAHALSVAGEALPASLGHRAVDDAALYRSTAAFLMAKLPKPYVDDLRGIPRTRASEAA